MIYSNKVLYWMGVFLLICSVAIDCSSVQEKQGIHSNLRKQMTVGIDDDNDDTSQPLNPHTIPSPQQQPSKCKQNFIYNNSTNTCACPQQNSFIYVQSSQQCKCFLGQIRINQYGSKICQKTQQINIGLFCLGLVIDFFIIYGIYKCCCSKDRNDGGYRRYGSRRCQRGFVRCLCQCLFNKGQGHHHHRDHHHNHNHHNRDHHHHKPHHHHNNTSPSLLTQQSS